MIKTTLFLLAIIAAYGVAQAQQMKMGETIIVRQPSANEKVKQQTSMHLFEADRGDRKGELLLVRSGPFRSDENPAQFTQYQLIGANKIKSFRNIGILGIHYLKVKPNRADAFEKFVVDKLHPAVGELLPDMQLLYYKATDGKNKDGYITVFGIESTGARHKYWPEGAPETRLVKDAFKPLNNLALELATYLVEGSYLEPSGGGAAYFESKEWTDYILQADNTQIPDGFEPLFNGKDLAGWKIPEGDNGHWKVMNTVIDYDAESESAGDKSLWSVKSYKDFILYVDFRIKATPWKNTGVPLILPNGQHKLDENGKEITITLPDSDSGILLRGEGKCQANIWCWPIGCGEVYGYRMDAAMPAEVRRGATPKTNADKNIGEWNRFKITFKGDRLTVELNGITVIENAQMPGIPANGPIGLQHHGSKKDGDWESPPSLVQFRNIYIKEL